jgi:hypothetical protein
MNPEEKSCPECAEQVKAAAKLCRFCGYRFDGEWKSSSTSPPEDDVAHVEAPSSKSQARARAALSSAKQRLQPIWEHGSRRLGPLKEVIAHNKIPLIALLTLIGGTLVAFTMANRSNPVDVPLSYLSLNDALSLGGEPSTNFPDAVALESLAAKKPEGHRLVASAFNDGVISSFQERQVRGARNSRFLIDGGPKAIKFRKGGMVVFAPGLRPKQTDQLFQLGLELYEFESTDGYGDLSRRAYSLVELIRDTTLYEGESYPEISSTAYELASDIRSWLEDNGDFVIPERKEYVESELKVAEAAAALGEQVDQGRLDSYNAALSVSEYAIGRLSGRED